jgi:hypothetical protein
VKRVVVRAKGGIGNQLFCYAAALRLAITNSAELVVDNTTGFKTDSKYKRTYRLNHFCISARLCNSNEKLEPFSRVRHFFARRFAQRQPFPHRRYLNEEQLGFDARILNHKVINTLYLDGYWQSYLYFQDQAARLNAELTIRITPSERLLHIARALQACNAVAVHYRCFDNHAREQNYNSLDFSYYETAIRTMLNCSHNPHFYVFTDDIPQATERFAQLDMPVTIVDTFFEVDQDIADLWLMTLCRNYIIANSTYSWWGAWLGRYSDKVVIAPKMSCVGVGAWGFDGLLPHDWLTI